MLNIVFKRAYVPGPICSQSIRWLINLRDRTWQKDGHDENRLKWLKQQSRTIDHIGWEAWLKSPNASGYDSIHKKPEHSLQRISNNNTN